MLTVTQESHEGAMVLNISGRFDFAGRKIFTDAMSQVQVGPVTHVVLNFQQVPFVDSAALGLLALTQQSLKLQNARISIVEPQEYVMKVFELANFPKFIPIFSTNEEALRSLALV